MQSPGHSGPSADVPADSTVYAGSGGNNIYASYDGGPQETLLTIELTISHIQKRIEKLEAFDPAAILERWSPEAKALETAIDETLAGVFGYQPVKYNRFGDRPVALRKVG